MDRKELLKTYGVILRDDFKGIPKGTVEVVKKLTKTGAFFEWELPGDPIKHAKIEEMGCMSSI